MLIIAAAFFLFHPAFAALCWSFTIKINTCFFSHTIVYLKSDSGGNAQVQYCKDSNGEFFHWLQM